MSDESKEEVDLENLIKNQGIVSYNPDCVRKKSNWSKASNLYKLDKDEFSPKTLLKDIPTHSPKLQTLLDKIDELDRKDHKKYGKLFKHFIFSDLKSGTYGAKLLAGALIAKGMKLGYMAKRNKSVKMGNDGEDGDDFDNDGDQGNDDDGYETDDDDDKEGTALHLVPLKNNKKIGGAKKVKPFGKIELLTEEQLKRTKQNNFYLLSSVTVFDQPISVATKKDILANFNKRPDNVHGDLARIIVMDSGFKEGIDLFDIKYIHIFEPSVVSADQKQVIGRGTRTCGQKGLEFHPTRGWPLYVFIYDLSIPEKLQPTFLDTKSVFDLYLKTMNLDVRLFHFAHDLEKTTILGSVDYDLNKNVHAFSIPSEDGEEGDEGEYVYGGGPKKMVGPRLKIVRRLDPDQNTEKRLGHVEMRQYIQDNYGEYAWDPVKMENLCAPKQEGGSGEVIKYTPTQSFISHYFTPACSVKGMLLSHSTGSGKTCSAIAAATTSFEKQGYTILWVTRTTLKNDIWKNMFDQVCNESIREKIQNHGLHMPKEQDKRMKLLSKSWKIRPMSYKQFSNLVSKQNSYYKDLVKINGEIDPLRKTLLIIDEAHKLYGGGDLSSIERPDMKALHQSLMSSYEISGGESVKLILMTATPITQNPMELIQLINLCKPQNEQMPTDFDEFSQEFLNEQGQFTDKGRDKYLDDISGYVSYLNREKDARQFSQPQIEAISSPIIKDMANVEKFDKRIVRELTKGETGDLKNQITEKQKELKGELGELDANTFNFLKEEICGDLDGKPLKQCSKVVKSNIKQLMAEARDEVKRIRSDIKELRERIKERSSVQKDAMTNVRENIIEHADQYEKYKESLFYSLKQKCAVKVSGKTALMTYVDQHPSMQGYNRTLQTLNDKIEELHDNLKIDIVKHKSRIDKLKKLLKTDLSELERSVINMTMKEAKVTQQSIMKLKKKETAKAEKDIKKSISDTKKLKKKQIMKIRKTIKATIKDNKKKENQTLKEQKKLRKTMRKEGTIKEEIKHDLLKELVDKYKGKITEDLVNIGVAEEESEMEKEDRKQDKLREQERKKEEKLRIAIEKKKQRDMKRDHKNDEKIKHRQTKKLEKEREKEQKKEQKEREKHEKKSHNKTKKSKK